MHSESCELVLRQKITQHIDRRQQQWTLTRACPKKKKRKSADWEEKNIYINCIQLNL